MKKHLNLKSPEFLISALGLLGLGGLYVYWLPSAAGGLPGKLAALLSAGLFALVCLGFVPRWMDFWRGNAPAAPAPAGEKPRAGLKIFLAFLAVDIGILSLVWLLRVLTGGDGGCEASLNFWLCLDSAHYIDIARDWYLSEGSVDRLVQLVFFPGYPLAVRLFEKLTGSFIWAGLLVSGLCFGLSGCVFYRLLRLDFSREEALRTLKYLCLLPGLFFFAAPMSESLFLLCCLCCLYLTRRGRWISGCLFGAYAAFTRSLGAELVIPLFFELIYELVSRRITPGNGARRLAALLIIPLGFAAYCFVNYEVSGNPFMFMEYQAQHWGQRLGFFFGTAAYQLALAISCFKTNPPNFWGLWLPNLICAFSALALMIPAARRLRPGYTAWFIAYFAVAIGATWLLSAPRYLAAMPAVPLALSLCAKTRKLDILLTSLCLALSLLYALAFVLRWQVW